MPPSAVELDESSRKSRPSFLHFKHSTKTPKTSKAKNKKKKKKKESQDPTYQNVSQINSGYENAPEAHANDKGRAEGVTLTDLNEAMRKMKKQGKESEDPTYENANQIDTGYENAPGAHANGKGKAEGVTRTDLKSVKEEVQHTNSNVGESGYSNTGSAGYADTEAGLYANVGKANADPQYANMPPEQQE